MKVYKVYTLMGLDNFKLRVEAMMTTVASAYETIPYLVLLVNYVAVVSKIRPRAAEASKICPRIRKEKSL